MNHLRAFPLIETLADGPVRLERRARGAARLCLARPEKRNAFDGAIVAALTAHLDALAAWAPADLRVLLLEGEGPVFCAGADLAHMRALGAADAEANRADARALAHLFQGLAAFPAPVVAAVRGAVIGGGLGLLACADLGVAEGSTRFATSEVRLGLLPAVISPYLLRKAGLGRLAPSLLTGAPFGVREAQPLGLVHAVAEGEGPWEAAVADQLEACLQAAPGAARATKALLLRQAPLPDAALAEATVEALVAARASAEGQAGLRAFLERSPAPWVEGEDRP